MPRYCHMTPHLISDDRQVPFRVRSGVCPGATVTLLPIGLPIARSRPSKCDVFYATAWPVSGGGVGKLR